MAFGQADAQRRQGARDCDEDHADWQRAAVLTEPPGQQRQGQHE